MTRCSSRRLRGGPVTHLRLELPLRSAGATERSFLIRAAPATAANRITAIRSTSLPKIPIVTAEDHQVHSGLGGAVAECLAQMLPTPQEFVAVNDTFGESGKGTELMEKYGIARGDIIKAAKRVLKRKK